MQTSSVNPSLRGQCESQAKYLATTDSNLRVVRGYYHCPVWGPQAHWWCEKSDGTIVDPTVEQFPSHSYVQPSFYEEYDGTLVCASCGVTGREGDEGWDIVGNGHYAVCSYRCHGYLVGIF